MFRGNLLNLTRALTRAGKLTPSIRTFSSSTLRQSTTSRTTGNRSNRIVSKGAAVFGGLCITYASCQLLFTDQLVAAPTNFIRLDAPNSVSEKTRVFDTVQPATKVDPFPTEIVVSANDYDLLGVGVRVVSYFFHVYALGIYIAKDDIPKARKVLSTLSSSEEDLKNALLDPKTGGDLVSKLFAAGIRLSIRIVPVRNTDFGHLRDGFVRAIVGQPRFKLSGDNGGEGIGELKRAFGRKRSVPKGQILYLNRLAGGQLSIEFYKSADESLKSHEVLGIVEEPLISELLFLKYLSGDNPSSEEARKSSIEGLVRLVSS